MADKIQYSDIIDPSVQKQLDELSLTIKNLTVELKKLSTATDEQDKESENYADTLKNEVELTEDLLRLSRDEINLKKRLKEAKDANTKAIKEGNYEGEKNIVTVKKAEETLRKHNFVVKNATKLTLAQAGSMTQLSLELANNRMQYRELSKAERENIKVGGKLLKTIQKQDAAIKKLDKSIGNNQRNVGNYTSAMTGMGGTLGMVAMQFQQALTTLTAFKTAMVASTAATTGTAKALKIFRLALISTGIGAIVVALGTLISYFTSAAEGTSKFRKVLAPLKAVLSTITKIIQDLGGAMYELLFGDSSKGWQMMKDSVSDVNGELRKQIDLQNELADVLNNSFQLEKNTTVALARMRSELQNQRKISHDEEKYSLKERAAAQQNAINLAESIGKIELQLLENEIKAAEIRSAMAKDSEDEELALQTLYAQRYQIQEGINKKSATYQVYLTQINREIERGASLQHDYNIKLKEYDDIITDIEIEDDPGSNKEIDGKIKLYDTIQQMRYDDISAEAQAWIERNTLLQEGYDEGLILTDEYNNRRKESDDKYYKFIKDQEKEKIQQAIIATAQTVSMIADVAEAAGVGAEAMKAFRIAETIINTYASATGAYNAMASIPYVGPALGAIAAATAVAAGLININKIMNTPIPSYAVGTEELSGDEVAQVHKGERILPAYLNKQITGIDNVDLPKLVNIGLNAPKIFDGITDMISQQQSTNTLLSRFAYVEKNGTVIYLSGDKRYYV